MAETTKDRIVEKAQELFFTQGYDSTPVEQIIRSVDIAKGTFYHHFSCKDALLDEIVRRYVDEGLELLRPVVEDREMNAEQKLSNFMKLGFAWKVDDPRRFFGLLRTLYSEENVLLRLRLTNRSIEAVVVPLPRIVRQGVAEGLFDTPIPERAGELALRLSSSLAECAARLFLELLEDPSAIDKIKALFNDMEYAMERLIGARAGTISMVDRKDMYRLVDAIHSGHEHE